MINKADWAEINWSGVTIERALYSLVRRLKTLSFSIHILLGLWQMNHSRYTTQTEVNTVIEDNLIRKVLLFSEWKIWMLHSNLFITDS